MVRWDRERRDMRKTMRRANPGEAPLILHVAIVGALARVDCLERRQVVPIDVAIEAPARFVQPVHRIFDRGHAVAQCEPVHVEKFVRAIRFPSVRP
jgi:hypothetical protein